MNLEPGKNRPALFFSGFRRSLNEQFTHLENNLIYI